MRRDSLAKVDFNDIDIATSATSEVVNRILKQSDFLIKEVGKSFGVVIAKKDNCEFEIQLFRKDIGCDGRHPEKIEHATMEEDASRRDFTINAIFFDPVKNIYYDYENGEADIKNKRLRFVGDIQQRISEDYLRILRFVRFWARGYIPSRE